MSFFRPVTPPPPPPEAARTGLEAWRAQVGNPTAPSVLFPKGQPPTFPPALGSGAWIVQSGDLGLADVRDTGPAYTVAVVSPGLAGRFDLGADSLFAWAYEIDGPAGRAVPTYQRLHAFIAAGPSWCRVIDPAVAAALHRLTLAQGPAAGDLAPLGSA